MIGRLVNFRYEILEKVGEGRLFGVYKALDRVHKGIVTVNILRSEIAEENEQFAQALIKELQAISNLSHPFVVRTYESGKEDGIYFVVTEFVKGESLEQKLKRQGPLNLIEALNIAEALCDALSYLHESGYVHGILTPKNILITEEGNVKLKDLGVYNSVLAAPQMLAQETLNNAPYISIEHAKGIRLGAYSDLYSLGVIIYEMLTGALPFDDKTPYAIILKHLQETPKLLTAIKPNIPKALQKLIMKLLEKEPKRRYQLAVDFLQDLLEFRSTLKEEVVPVSTSPEVLKKRIALAPDVLEEVGKPFLRTFAWLLWMVVGILALVLIVYWVFIITMPRDVMVPDILGKPVEEAQRMLKGNKLNLQIQDEEYSEEVPAGCVLRITDESTQPHRTVKEGRTIFVIVSKGSALVEVPDLKGYSIEEANKRLSDVKLNLGSRDWRYDENIPKDYVIEQSPKAGVSVKRDSSVNLVISKGPKPEEIVEGPAPSQKTAMVKITVPPGPNPKEVKITVTDAEGESVVYQQFHEPGDKIEHQVWGYGEVVVRVYIDGELIEEKAL